MLTKKLNNGFTVLAKQAKDGSVTARTYANQTQAQKAAAAVGPQAQVYQPRLGPCFYVIVEIAIGDA